MEKKHSIELTLSGIGYKADYDSTNNQLILSLGFSHPIILNVPEDIKVSVKKENKPAVGTGDGQRITLVGPSFNVLSNYAQKIKRFRKPDPYKAKGVIIRNRKDLEAVKIFRKEGKQKN